MASPEQHIDPKLVPLREKTELAGAQAEALLHEFKTALRAYIHSKPTNNSRVMRGRYWETIQVFLPDKITINFTQHFDQGTAKITLHESYDDRREHITRKETIRWEQEDRLSWIPDWIPIARPTRMAAKSDVVMILHHDANNERRLSSPPGIRTVARHMIDLLK